MGEIFISGIWKNYWNLYTEFIFLLDSQKNVNKASDLFVRIFEKKRKTHKKTSGRAVVTAYSDVPYKPTIKETMGW